MTLTFDVVESRSPHDDNIQSSSTFDTKQHCMRLNRKAASVTRTDSTLDILHKNKSHVPSGPTYIRRICSWPDQSPVSPKCFGLDDQGTDIHEQRSKSLREAHVLALAFVTSSSMTTERIKISRSRHNRLYLSDRSIRMYSFCSIRVLVRGS